MKNIPVSNIRNFVVMGHPSCGKTSLVDALLYRLGENDRLGSVDNGSSMADYTDEEKSRKITIFAKPFGATYKTAAGETMEYIFTDTPGYMDFFGQVIAGARAGDTGVIVVDAVAGVQVGTHRSWKCCSNRGMAARAVVVTGLDKDNADFMKTVADLQSAFGATCVPVVLPGPDGESVVDVLASTDIPEGMAAEVQALKGQLVELAAETDDTLIEKFLEGQELTPAEMAHGLDIAVAAGGLVPVFAAMPLKSIGITEFLEGAARLLPHPGQHQSTSVDGEVIGTGENDPLVALVWRIVNDPFVGQLTFVRVMGGVLTSDSEIMNTTSHQKERVGSLLLVNGKKQSNVIRATAGDIVAIPKLKATRVGDTLCAVGHNICIPPIRFPPPVTFQAVEAKTQADEDKIGTALQRVCDEDPTLHVVRNKETREMVLQGLGDTHLDVAVGLMKNRSHVDVVLSTPKVPYRETVTSKGEGHYKHKKQSGGRGQFGEVYLRVEPKHPDDDEWFVNAIVGGVIPGNFIPAVQKGLTEGMTAGALAGFPVSNIKVTVYDGSYHDVDSSEIAFKIAGSRALKDAMLKARPVLLEPIMAIKVHIPDHCMGDITGDLNHKRGRILGMGTENGMQTMEAEAPQSELFRYAAELRSITAGQGTFEMEFSRYDQVPAHIADKVIAAAEKQGDDA
ncbi:MAG: elongation factor G [Verrucomicrobia bacterium]|nr:elongation factor G [Verrucomicrobiota bacterium]